MFLALIISIVANVLLIITTITIIVANKRTTKMNARTHKTALNTEWHVGFKAGWDQGNEYGRRKQRIATMHKNLKTTTSEDGI